MDSQLPSYLKSLESIIAGSSNTVPLATATPMFVTSQTQGQTQTQTQLQTTTQSKKLKFLLVSTHSHQFTGYSKVSHHMLQILSKLPWIQLTHYGFQKFPNSPPGYRTYPSCVDVIDAASLEKEKQQGFGFSALPDVIRKKQPHVVMIYNDMSVVTKFLEEIRKSGIPRTFKIWVYCDRIVIGPHF
jgi:hypothetical protein